MKEEEEEEETTVVVVVVVERRQPSTRPCEDGREEGVVPRGVWRASAVLMRAVLASFCTRERSGFPQQPQCSFGRAGRTRQDRTG